MGDSEKTFGPQERRPGGSQAFSEAKVRDELQRLVAGLPRGAASFCQLPEEPEWSCRYYEVKPSNDGAARIVVGVVLNDIHLTIGEVECELIGFGRGGTIVPEGGWLDDLRWIWQVVTAGGFSQRQYFDSKGNVIGGASVLRLNDIDYDFRCGRTAETVFGKRKFRDVLFEPYY